MHYASLQCFSSYVIFHNVETNEFLTASTLRVDKNDLEVFTRSTNRIWFTQYKYSDSVNRCLSIHTILLSVLLIDKLPITYSKTLFLITAQSRSPFTLHRQHSLGWDTSDLLTVYLSTPLYQCDRLLLRTPRRLRQPVIIIQCIIDRHRRRHFAGRWRRRPLMVATTRSASCRVRFESSAGLWPFRRDFPLDVRTRGLTSISLHDAAAVFSDMSLVRKSIIC